MLPPPSVMMVSAQRDAKRRPRGEPPAWQIGNTPLRRARRVDRSAASWKILALVVDGMDLAAVGDIGLSRSSTTASGSHASHRRVTTSANSSAMS